MVDAPSQQLRRIPPSKIEANHENPRLVFRQEEMESLMLSIDKHGVQVPITVYEDGDHYTLIDGERRWKCATKLNLREIPALVQEKPTELQNLVLMYNIHALREQWDYYTIASKLERVIALFLAEHKYTPNEVILSELTGLTRGAIRRCQLIINLPDRFKVLLLSELEKPKSQQRLSEDLFIEMEKSLRTVVRRLPEYRPRLDEIRESLVGKYRSKTIGEVTDFRQLSKIATAVEKFGLAHKTAQRALDRVFDPNDSVGIKQAYSETVEFEYVERRAAQNAAALISFVVSLEEEHKKRQLDRDLSVQLRRLRDLLNSVLRE